ncbi:hypothetical protein GCM10022419_133130 [Nonomuraea rosea]|uniref:Tn3 transposase DDE domain-containing protein n=1 Tax=Nonomuraea rosea TaxID=638574 RepID=A0ABP7A4R9_9ACTN
MGGLREASCALGLGLNAIVWLNTVYIDDALHQLRVQGYPVLDDDIARLSPFVRRHINVHGGYSFQRPQLSGGRRALRDPEADDADDEDRRWPGMFPPNMP